MCLLLLAVTAYQNYSNKVKALEAQKAADAMPAVEKSPAPV